MQKLKKDSYFKLSIADLLISLLIATLLFSITTFYITNVKIKSVSSGHINRNRLTNFLLQTDESIGIVDIEKLDNGLKIEFVSSKKDIETFFHYLRKTISESIGRQRKTRWVLDERSPRSLAGSLEYGQKNIYCLKMCRQNIVVRNLNSTKRYVYSLNFQYSSDQADE